MDIILALFGGVYSLGFLRHLFSCVFNVLKNLFIYVAFWARRIDRLPAVNQNFESAKKPQQNTLSKGVKTVSTMALKNEAISITPSKSSPNSIMGP